jgi:hypothetical protein
LETISGDLIFADDLSYHGANVLKAFRDNQCGVTVEQYYCARYNITLKYPNIPCIIVKGGNNDKYFYPLETLKVYDPDNLPNEQQTKVSRICTQTKPRGESNLLIGL